jgi:hypothetical protein
MIYRLMPMELDELLAHINAIAKRQHEADHALIETLREGAEAEALLDDLPTDRMSDVAADLVAVMRAHHRIHRAQYEERYGVPYTDERARMHAGEPAFREWARRKRDA